MALSAPSVLTSNLSGSASTTRTTASFTPSANAILVVGFHVLAGSSPPSPTWTDSAGLTWTTITDTGFNSTNRYTVKWAQVGASPSAMTVTADYGATSTSSASWGVVELTGHNTTTPIVTGSTQTGSGTSTTPATATVPALSASGNYQLLFVAARTSSCTAEAGWTELFDRNGATTSLLAAYYTGTPGDTSPTATLSGSAIWRCVGFEVAEGGLTLAASGSEVTVADGSPIYAGAFNAFRGLVLKWP